MLFAAVACKAVIQRFDRPQVCSCDDCALVALCAAPQRRCTSKRPRQPLCCHVSSKELVTAPATVPASALAPHATLKMTTVTSASVEGGLQDTTARALYVSSSADHA
jgi:hypothetical protein